MGIFDKITNIFKKTQISAEIITNSIPVSKLSDDKYRIIYDNEKTGHLIPTEQFKSDMNPDEIKAFPIINEPMQVFSDMGVFVHPFGVSPSVSYDVLWTYFRYTPEIVAIIRAIVEDIMSDGWVLKGGRNNKLKVEKFLMKNYAKEQISSMLFDTMVTGDGYLYLQKLSKAEVKGRIFNMLEKPEIKGLLNDEIKTEMGENIFRAIEDDEDIFTARSFVNVASSTMKAQFDKNGDVHKWIQKVGVRVQTFQPEEIIHFRLLRLDGKFYGFSPMASILKEMDILANVKDYARYYFEKGGVPNFLFTLKNETPNSENFKQFKKTLQLFASLANKYKSIVVTGEVDAKELNKMGKDMEFRDLAKYLTQILIMTWGVPTARLSDIGFGDKMSKGSVISEQGYYRKISHMQDLVEDLINMELLSPFKVTMKFKKTYLQDEIRRVQTDKIKTDTAEQRMALGVWNREMAGEYLGIDPEDLPDEEEIAKQQANMPPKQGGGTGKAGNPQLTDVSLLSHSEDKVADAMGKERAASGVKSRTFEKEYPKIE